MEGVNSIHTLKDQERLARISGEDGRKNDTSKEGPRPEDLPCFDREVRFRISYMKWAEITLGCRAMGSHQS